MKKIVSLITFTAALSLFGATALRAQESAEATAEEAVKRAQTEAQKAQDKVRAQLEQTRQQLQATQQRLPGLPQAVGGPPGSYTERLQAIIRRAPGRGVSKPLAILSTNMDPKEQGNLEEDMTIMTHLLDKTIDELPGGPSHTSAMGIDVVFPPGSSPMRSLYVEGYGALFLLRVNFPLLPPPPKTAEEEKPPADSTWEEARQELYGQGPGGGIPAGPVEEFKQEKVNKLTEALLEALKNAANIRGLKPDDSITVCVTGGPGAVSARAKVAVRPGRSPAPMPPAPAIPPRVIASGPSGGALPPTIMTIRVKKSDVDALAKGSLELDQFRKQARITTYVGSASVDGGGAAFGGGGFGRGGF